MRAYECEVTKTFNYRDNDNFPAHRSTSWTEADGTLAGLYERLAEARKNWESGRPEEDEEWTEVDFGPIREIEVLSETAVDEAMLSATNTWRSHQASLDAARRAEEEQQAQVDEEQARQREAKEREQLAALLKKYPEAATGSA